MKDTRIPLVSLSCFFLRLLSQMLLLRARVCVGVCVRTVKFPAPRASDVAHPPLCHPLCVLPSSGEEEVAHGMKVWRKALTEVRSAAQLAMCIQQLQKSIAWERSIMKVVSSCWSKR